MIKRRRHKTRIFAAAFSLLCLIACFAADGHAHAAEVRIRDHIRTTEPVVKLGDIADIHSVDGQQAVRLKQIMLIPAPAAGGEVRLGFAEIRSKMQAQGFNLADMKFTGHSQVTIETAQPLQPLRHGNAVAPPRPVKAKPLNTTELKSLQAELVQTINRFIRVHHPGFGEPVVTLKPDQKKLTLFNQQRGNGYQITAIKSIHATEQAAILQIRSQDGSVTELPIHCQIKQKPKVLAARFDLPRGHVIQQRDLLWIYSEQETGEAPLQPDDVIGQQTQRPLRQGDPLHDYDLKAMTLIKSGQLVTVTAGVAGVRVRTQMKARSSGALGELVKLLPLNSREEIRARVTGPRRATMMHAGTDSAPPEITSQKRNPTSQQADVLPTQTVNQARHFMSGPYRNQSVSRIPTRPSNRNQFR